MTRHRHHSRRNLRVRAGRVLALALGTLLVGAAVLLMPSPALAASSWTVTDGVDDPASTPGSFRWAVAQAGSGDTISFASSVTSLTLSATVMLPLGVTVDGSGAGGSVVVLAPAAGMSDALLTIAPNTAAQDYAIQNLELTGAGTGAVSRGIRVTGGTSVARNVALAHLTVQNFAADVGAGIRADQITGTLTVDSSILRANTATGFGGSALSYTAPSGVALVISSTTISGNQTSSSSVPADGAVSIEGSPAASVTLSSDTITDNLVGNVGGFTFITGAGLSLGTDDGSSGALTITDSVFRGNGLPDATHVSAYYGGGLASSRAASVTISGTTFDNNRSRDGAGGFFLDNMTGPVVLRGDILTGNSMSGGGGTGIGGGGFFANNSGATSISGLTVARNVGGNGAGLEFRNQSGAVSIDSSTFGGNSAQSGGGIYFEAVSSAVTVSNSTFGADTVTSGGAGIFASQIEPGASLTISNSTFEETASTSPATPIQVDAVAGTFTLANSTVVSGLGVDLGILDGPSARIDHTIVQAPSGTAAITVDNPGSGPDLEVSWSLLSSALGARETNTAGNLLSTDAALGPLADNGGPTQTMLPQIGSPAIDAGDPAFAGTAGAVTSDQRGLPRVVRRIDIGAVELQPAAATATPVAAALAATGEPIGAGLASALLLMFVGGAVLMRSRRRSR